MSGRKLQKDIEADKIFFCNKPKLGIRMLLEKFTKDREVWGREKDSNNRGLNGRVCLSTFGHLFNGKV